MQGNHALKLWSWILILIAAGRIVASWIFFSGVPPYGRLWQIYLPMHLELLAPYAFLAVAVAFTRTPSPARWGLGVIGLQAFVSLAFCYEAPREFWQYLDLWVFYVTIG